MLRRARPSPGWKVTRTCAAPSSATTTTTRGRCPTTSWPPCPAPSGLCVSSRPQRFEFIVAQFEPEIFGETRRVARGGTIECLGLHSVELCEVAVEHDLPAAHGVDHAAGPGVDHGDDGVLPLARPGLLVCHVLPFLRLRSRPVPSRFYQVPNGSDLSVAYARINLSAALAMSLIALTSTLSTRTAVLLEAAPPERTPCCSACRWRVRAGFIPWRQLRPQTYVFACPNHIASRQPSARDAYYYL